MLWQVGDLDAVHDGGQMQSCPVLRAVREGHQVRDRHRATPRRVRRQLIDGGEKPPSLGLDDDRVVSAVQLKVGATEIVGHLEVDRGGRGLRCRLQTPDQRGKQLGLFRSVHPSAAVRWFSLEPSNENTEVIVLPWRLIGRSSGTRQL